MQKCYLIVNIVIISIDIYIGIKRTPPFLSGWLCHPAKREPVALKVQRHADNTNVLPEQKGVGLEFSVSGKR